MKVPEIKETPSLREQVADIIRNMIIKRELTCGQQISERNISKILNVSTTPVKEAFRILESEGLVYSVPRKGSYVSDFSVEKMFQVAFMRSSLEGLAAYFAAMYATEEEIILMEEYLLKSRELVEKRGDSKLIAEYNIRFHEVLRTASRNDYLNSLVKSMSTIDNAIRQNSLVKDDDEPFRAQGEHEAVLDAIKEKNPEEAEKRMISHVRRVARFTLQEIC